LQSKIQLLANAYGVKPWVNLRDNFACFCFTKNQFYRNKKFNRGTISCPPHLRLAVDLGEVLHMLGIVLRCLAVQLGEVLRYLAMQLGEVLKRINVYFRMNFLPMSGQFKHCWIRKIWFVFLLETTFNY
jgi:hypothetical protein